MTVFVCYSNDPDCEILGPVFSYESDAIKYCEDDPSYVYQEKEVELDDARLVNNACGTVLFGDIDSEDYYLGFITTSNFAEHKPVNGCSVYLMEDTKDKTEYKLSVYLAYDAGKTSPFEARKLVANATKELGMELLSKLQAGYSWEQLRYYAKNKKFNQSELWEG